MCVDSLATGQAEEKSGPAEFWSVNGASGMGPRTQYEEAGASSFTPDRHHVRASCEQLRAGNPQVWLTLGS